VSKVTFSYNVTYQDTLKCSPFVCVFGREPVLPAHHLFPSEASQRIGNPVEPSVEEHQNRVDRLHNVQDHAKQNIEAYQEKAKENFARWNSSKRSSKYVLKEGDYVQMLKPGKPRGFVLHWEGPYIFQGWADDQKLKARLSDGKGQEWNRSTNEIVAFKPRELFHKKIIEPLLQARPEQASPVDVAENTPLEPAEIASDSEIVLEFDSRRPEDFPDYIPFDPETNLTSNQNEEEEEEVPLRRTNVGKM
jgi:hypothetical protein